MTAHHRTDLTLWIENGRAAKLCSVNILDETVRGHLQRSRVAWIPQGGTLNEARLGLVDVGTRYGFGPGRASRTGSVG
jgi:hypothetical protein